VGLAIAESFDRSGGSGSSADNNIDSTTAQVSTPQQNVFTGIASSPNLTLSGAKTAVGLAIAESFDRSGGSGSSADNNIDSTTAQVSTPPQSEFTGIASSPNLTLGGAKTAVGLVIAESFDEGNHCFSSSKTLTKAEGIVASHKGKSCRAPQSQDDTGMNVLPPRDRDHEENNGDADASWVVEWSDRLSPHTARQDINQNQQNQMEKQPTSIPHAPSDASSLYEEEGERIRQQSSKSDTITTSRTLHSRSKSTSTGHTPSSAGRTWAHYHQYYGEEGDEDDSEDGQCEYTALHRPMLEIHGDADVSRDISFSSRQGFLSDVNGSRHGNNLQGYSLGDRGGDSGRDGAYDFGRLDGIGPKSLASLDGSSIRPVPSLDGGPMSSSNDENVGDLGNLPLSPPSVPGQIQRDLDTLPTSPPSLPNGSLHDFDALPRSPPSVPEYLSNASNGSRRTHLIASDNDIDNKFQRQSLHAQQDVIKMGHIFVGPSRGTVFNNANVSMLSHRTEASPFDEENHAWPAMDITAASALAALARDRSGQPVDKNLDNKRNASSPATSTSDVEEELNNLSNGNEQKSDIGQPHRGFALDEDLIRRKHRNQKLAVKEKQMKGIVERLRDASNVVRTVCSTKGLLGQAAVSLLSGYEAAVRDNILVEMDALLSFVYGDDDTRASIRFVRVLVESAPVVSSDFYEEESALETPRNVPAASTNAQDTHWNANDVLLRALGVGGYASPHVVRGGDTSLFSLPTNSTIPNISNASMATTIASENTSLSSPPVKSLTAASRRLRLTAEAVVVLIQQISVAAYRLPQERMRDDTVWAASVEEIKRSYHHLMRISEDDIGALESAFVLQECTPLPSQKQQNHSDPPALTRGANATKQCENTAKRLDLSSPDVARLVDGEISNPPVVVRAIPVFDQNASPMPVVPTVSEEPEDSSDDGRNDSDDDSSTCSEDDSSSSPRDLLTSFEEEANDSADYSELTSFSAQFEEEEDGDDDTSINSSYQVGVERTGGRDGNPATITSSKRDRAGEDLRRLCFDTSMQRATDEDGLDAAERDAPSTSVAQEMSV